MTSTTRTQSDPLTLPHPRAHLTNPNTRASLQIQHATLTAVRSLLDSLDFAEVLPPVIGPATDPGVRGAKNVPVDFYGTEYRLMTSAILYKQATLLTFDKIYCVAPNVRLEPLDAVETSRHLAEFHQIDVEIAHASRAQAMDIANQILSKSVEAVLSTCQEQLSIVGRDATDLEAAIGTYPILTHAEAVTQAIAAGATQDPNSEITWEAERILSSKAQTPFFIVDYPHGSRGFYDKLHPNTETLLSFDLIAPEGFGELSSGGQREHDHDQLQRRMHETGEAPQDYEWYLELAREYLPPSAGFGIGLERLLRYITGADAVWEVAAFPKVPGVPSP